MNRNAATVIGSLAAVTILAGGFLMGLNAGAVQSTAQMSCIEGEK